MNGELTKYNAAKRALAEAHRIDEVKDIRDKAVALRTYAFQAKDRVLIDHATEIRLRAERRAGELLKEMAERGERDSTGGDRKSKSQPATMKLSDLNVNKSQSSRWQKLAEIEEDDFEELVANAKQKAGDSIDRAQKQKPKPKPKPAKKDNGDIVATCVREVETIVRAAFSKVRDPDERAGLCEQLEKAIRVIKNEAAARDEPSDSAARGRADENRWTER